MTMSRITLENKIREFVGLTNENTDISGLDEKIRNLQDTAKSLNTIKQELFGLAFIQRSSNPPSTTELQNISSLIYAEVQFNYLLNVMEKNNKAETKNWLIQNAHIVKSRLLANTPEYINKLAIGVATHPGNEINEIINQLAITNEDLALQKTANELLNQIKELRADEASEGRKKFDDLINTINQSIPLTQAFLKQQQEDIAKIAAERPVKNKKQDVRSTNVSFKKPVKNTDKPVINDMESWLKDLSDLVDDNEQDSGLSRVKQGADPLNTATSDNEIEININNIDHTAPRTNQATLDKLHDRFQALFASGAFKDVAIGLPREINVNTNYAGYFNTIIANAADDNQNVRTISEELNKLYQKKPGRTPAQVLYFHPDVQNPQEKIRELATYVFAEQQYQRLLNQSKSLDTALSLNQVALKKHFRSLSRPEEVKAFLTANNLQELKQRFRDNDIPETLAARFMLPFHPVREMFEKNDNWASKTIATFYAMQLHGVDVNSNSSIATANLQNKSYAEIVSLLKEPDTLDFSSPIPPKEKDAITESIAKHIHGQLKYHKLIADSAVFPPLQQLIESNEHRETVLRSLVKNQEAFDEPFKKMDNAFNQGSTAFATAIRTYMPALADATVAMLFSQINEIKEHKAAIANPVSNNKPAIQVITYDKEKQLAKALEAFNAFNKKYSAKDIRNKNVDDISIMANMNPERIEYQRLLKTLAQLMPVNSKFRAEYDNYLQSGLTAPAPDKQEKHYQELKTLAMELENYANPFLHSKNNGFFKTEKEDIAEVNKHVEEIIQQAYTRLGSRSERENINIDRTNCEEQMTKINVLIGKMSANEKLYDDDILGLVKQRGALQSALTELNTPDYKKVRSFGKSGVRNYHDLQGTEAQKLAEAIATIQTGANNPATPQHNIAILRTKEKFVMVDELQENQVRTNPQDAYYLTDADAIAKYSQANPQLNISPNAKIVEVKTQLAVANINGESVALFNHGGGMDCLEETDSQLLVDAAKFIREKFPESSFQEIAGYLELGGDMPRNLEKAMLAFCYLAKGKWPELTPYQISENAVLKDKEYLKAMNKHLHNPDIIKAITGSKDVTLAKYPEEKSWFQKTFGG